MVGCGALRCLNVSIKYKKQVDRYEKIVEEKSQAKGRGQEGKVRIYLLCFNIHCKLLKAAFHSMERRPIILFLKHLNQL